MLRFVKGSRSRYRLFPENPQDGGAEGTVGEPVANLIVHCVRETTQRRVFIGTNGSGVWYGEPGE